MKALFFTTIIILLFTTSLTAFAGECYSIEDTFTKEGKTFIVVKTSKEVYPLLKRTCKVITNDEAVDIIESLIGAETTKKPVVVPHSGMHEWWITGNNWSVTNQVQELPEVFYVVLEVQQEK